MIDLHPLASDADLGAWADVTAAVEGVRWTLADMRVFTARESRLYALGLLDGEPAGSLVAGPSDVPGSAFAQVRVRLELRRRGLGTALLAAGRDHARALGFARLGADVRAGDEESLAFARKRAFEEFAVEVELVRELAGDDGSEPALPPGLEVLPLASRPDLVASAWEVCRDGYRDLVLPEPVEMSREGWLEEDVEGPRVLADLTLVAVRDGRVAAFAGLLRYGSDTAAAEHGLTAVRPNVRGQGLGTLLKQVQAARAERAGIRRLVTWTQEGNEAMRAVNEKLGYVERPAWIKLSAHIDAIRA